MNNYFKTDTQHLKVNANKGNSFNKVYTNKFWLTGMPGLSGRAKDSAFVLSVAVLSCCKDFILKLIEVHIRILIK